MRIKNLVFHFIILGTIVGLAALGIWQLQRREWKHELLQTLQQHLEAAPVELDGLNATDADWHSVIATGIMRFDRTIFVPYFYHVTEDSPGIWGYALYVPLQTRKQTVLVREGWIKSELRPLFEKLKAQENFIARGIWRPFDRRPLFMPQRKAKGNEQDFADSGLYETLGYSIQNYYLDSTQSGDYDEDVPLSLWHKPDLPDNHLQYAITWFALAGVLLALYLYKISHDRRS